MTTVFATWVSRVPINILALYLQGDTSGCSLGSVDIKAKVPLFSIPVAPDKCQDLELGVWFLMFVEDADVPQELYVLLLDLGVLKLLLERRTPRKIWLQFSPSKVLKKKIHMQIYPSNPDSCGIN